MFAGALATAALIGPPAHAAALDCGKAQRPHDKTICADPTLHQLDQDLAAAYARLADVASDAGRAQVARDERDRRTFAQERCTASDVACLTAAYRQGVSSVAKFADLPSSAVLIPVEHFRIGPASQKDPGYRASVQLAFPRLDRPIEPWSDQFETAARQTAERLLPDDVATDALVDYRPTFIAPDLVAVAFDTWTYPDHAAHGMGQQVAFNYLPAQQRTLHAADLFQSGTTWSGFLAERAFAGLQAQAASGGWSLSVSGPGELEAAVADPANWQIHPDGLGLYFAPTTVGPYVAGEHAVLVPWADLKPYLVEQPAFKIPGL